MPISHHLLDILRCPISHDPLKPLEPELLTRLNGAIGLGEIHHDDGLLITQPLTAGLITLTGKWIYRIDDDIPVMLVEQAIPAPAGLIQTPGQ